MNEEQYQKSVRAANIGRWIATRASRTTGLVSKLCRFVMGRLMRIDPDKDFMKDTLIDNDQGYSAEALEKYERGEE